MYKDRKFFTLLILGILVLLYPAHAFAIEYGGIGVRPANPREEDPKTESIIVQRVDPGDVVEEGVIVLNNTEEDKTLIVYPADSTPSTDGGFACKQLAEEQTGVGQWINLAVSEITLKSKGLESIPFKINIPADVEPGEQNGCIIVQEKKAPSEAKSGINLSIRTGLRVALTVAGEIVKDLSIQNFEISKKPELVIIRPSIRNSGTVSVDADIKVNVINRITKKQVQEYGGIYTIYRNDTASWNYEMKNPFWGGFFSTDLQVKYNDGTQDQVLNDGPISFFILPSTQALIYIGIVVLIPFLFILFFLLRIVSRKRKSRNWIVYKVISGDTLKDLAESRNVKWKLVARVNKLKAPYDLRPGQEIKLPPIKEK